MTNFDAAGNSPDVRRLSNADRDQAVALLRQHYSEGRLTEPEFGERAQSVRSAVTRGDLTPLFADLPPLAATATAQPAPFGSPDSTPAYAPPTQTPAPTDGRTRATIMAVIPFVALALFFITGNLGGWGWSWIWFLLIPAAGAIVYGGGGGRRR
jgi:hypothetical protein